MESFGHMLPTLRPYQEAGIEALREHVANGRKRVILCACTGGGKTVLASAIIHSGRHNYNAKILFIAHRRELIDQTVKQLARWDVHEVGVIRADDERTNALMPVQVATIQSLTYSNRRTPPPADIIFIDECFPAGTLVDGRPIESVRPGQMVRSFDPTTGKVELKHVVRSMQSQPSTLVRVYLENGKTLVCTRNHRIWTREGWIAAEVCLGRDVMLDIATFARVDRVEVLERTSDGTFGGMCPDGLVYNLEVEETHTYFANGVAVSNCHRAVADSYRKLLEIYPDANIIGLTATPCRFDGKPLGDVFQAIEVAATYKDLIKDGFIVEPRCFGTPVEPKLDNVHTQHGDFVIDELADAMMEIDVLGDTVAEYKKHAGGRRTVVFAVNVAHSKSLLEKFLAAGVRAAHVDAETPESERLAISKKLDTGELEVVCNCQIFTEGWDQPCVKCLIIARPTKSLVVFMQQAGRGLRPWNANTPSYRSWQPEDGPSVQPIIIDQGGNLERHGFPHEDRKWSLEGRAERSEKNPTKCIKCLAYIKHYPCEACGFAPPVPPPREIVQQPNTELQERAYVDPRKAFFDRKVEEARLKGFKPSFASVKYKEEYGEYPPWSWGQGAKEAYANDEMWKRRMANKEADRARWKKQEEENRTPQYDTDEDFAEWARRES